MTCTLQYKYLLNLLELAFLDHRLEKKFCIPPKTSIHFECSDWLCDVN